MEKFIWIKKNKNKNKKTKNAYGLLETIISIFLCSLLFLNLSFILYSFLNYKNKFIEFYPTLENLKLSYLFLDKQLDRSKIIEIYDNDPRNKIIKFIFDNNEEHTLSFDRSKNIIKFGNDKENELAKNIKDIEINFDYPNKILNIKITSEKNNFRPVLFNKNVKDKIIIKKNKY